MDYVSADFISTTSLAVPSENCNGFVGLDVPSELYWLLPQNVLLICVSNKSISYYSFYLFPLP